MAAKLDAAEKEIASLQAELSKLKERNETLIERVSAHEENAFSYTMANLDAGGVLIEAGQKVGQLAEVVRQRQKAGKLTLTLSVKPFKGDALVFTSDLKVTEPKLDPTQSIFYSGEGGKISRNDPRQREFDDFR